MKKHCNNCMAAGIDDTEMVWEHQDPAGWSVKIYACFVHGPVLLERFLAHTTRGGRARERAEGLRARSDRKA